MLTHANAIGVAEIFCREARVVPDDTSLAYLPMAWAGDSVYTLFASLMVGFCANCPESPETVQRDLRELGPSTILAPPRIWENMLTGLQVRAADATPLKRRTFEYFRSAAERAEILRSEGKAVPAGPRLATAPRTWAPSPTARPSRRNSSRTSSSIARSSARPSPSAMSVTSWPP